MTDSIYDKLPAYIRIKLFIKERVEKGIWVPHTKLPPEEELCSMFGVARGTVRQALSELTNEGVIYRVHGKGTFIKATDYEHDLDSRQFISFWDEMMGKGVRVNNKVLSVERCMPDAKVASHLFPDCNPEEVFRIRRLRGIGDKMIMYSVNNIPCDLYPGLADAPQNLLSIYGMLKSRCGIDIDMGQRLFTCLSATQELASLLEIEEGYPLILAEQMVYDDGGRCLDCAYLWLRSENFRLSITIHSKKK